MSIVILRRWLRRVGWLSLVLLLVLIAGWTAMNVVGSSQWEQSLGELRTAGFKVSLESMASPPLPASENAAPYYTAAFALHVAEDPPLEVEKRVRAMSEEERASLKEWLSRNKESFEMITRARKRPRCRFERDYRQGYAMLMPELAPMIKIADALRLRAELQALEGDVAGARESIRAIFDMADTQRSEPILIIQLVRVTMVTRALEGLAACVTAETGEAELKKWREIVPDPDVMFGEALQTAFRGEMALLADLLSRPLPQVLGVELPQFQGIWGWLYRPWILSDGATYMSIMRRAADASVRPYPEARIEFDELTRLCRKSSQWTQPICSLLLPALFNSLDATTAARARLAVARAGLGATGRVPAALTEINPFTGKPLTLDAATGRIVCDAVPAAQQTIFWQVSSK